MSSNNNGSPFPKIVYFRVKVNGKMDLVSMEMNADGSLKYRKRYVDEYHQGMDSKSSASSTSKECS